LIFDNDKFLTLNIAKLQYPSSNYKLLSDQDNRSNLPIITLTSDWGLKDHYLAVIKATILKRLPGVAIVDISHQISPFNLKEASYIVRNSFRSFPEGTIHIIGVNTEETLNFPHTAVFADGHYFIGTDNGIFSLIFDKKPEKMIEITIPQDSDLFTFSTRDRFVKAAVHIAEGKPIEELGPQRTKWSEQSLFQPAISDNVIKGIVIYIDNYENVITNITEEVFKKVRKGRKFVIAFRGEQLDQISKAYMDVPVSEIVALFGSTGYLEIAINQGNASSLLGLYLNDPVRIEFNE
jgi:S-adenosylmethionine hydrolase